MRDTGIHVLEHTDASELIELLFTRRQAKNAEAITQAMRVLNRLKAPGHDPYRKKAESE